MLDRGLQFPPSPVTVTEIVALKIWPPVATPAYKYSDRSGLETLHHIASFFYSVCFPSRAAAWREMTSSATQHAISLDQRPAAALAVRLYTDSGKLFHPLSAEQI